MALAFVVTLALVTTDAPARPNVLIFLSDDHSAQHLGCYGNADIHTPQLDKFAAQGMRFDRAYVTAPQCVPSRASIMTGRSPVRIGMSRFSAPLPADVIMFPELLRQAGYFTGVAGRSHHLDGAPTSEISREVFKRHNLGDIGHRLDVVRKVTKTGEGPSFNDAVIEQFGDFLNAVPAGREFFLQLCTSDPHRPFDGRGIAAPHDPAKLKLPAWFPDTQEVRRDLAAYYDEVSRMDETFGRVMAELDRRGLAANTLVIFMGDNGASQLRGKGTLYEFGIHVPLLVRWPGVTRSGAASGALVSGEDIAPTVLEAAGLAIPADWTGRSFAAMLRGENAASRRQIFAERGAHGSELPGDSAGFDLGRVVVTKTHKLIYNALPELPYTPVDFMNSPAWRETIRAAELGRVPASLIPFYTGQRRPMFELYDLEHDPDELVNLAGRSQLAAVESDLKDALQEWMILERDFLPLPVFEGKSRHSQR